MDSLTQIILGAAVGEAVLGKKIGNKALFYGAIAGTIPDLDVLASYFTDTVTALSIHRGFTHSILFSILFAPIFGWLVSRYEKYKNFKGWSWLFFWAFITHPILDAHTTWGTQFFWPFDIRLAFKTIFVIDPLYTMPFLIFLILAIRQKRTSRKRYIYNTIGLVVSSSYLVLTFFFKWIAFNQFEAALKNQNISYLELDTRPSPMNTVLWSANVATENAYLLANYSFFDTQPITFNSYPKNHHLLGKIADNIKIKQMIAISEGWYTITKKDKNLYYNDLRFGLLSLAPNSQNFVFKYKIIEDRLGNILLKEEPKDKRDGKKLLSELWIRLKGN
ncbi:metal-dependent hydrolase [Tenacibaculum sp. HL-MS23]|uniref:metal-dependent hydrolase n=1 Tax=unclassified Tenacibaculum TaxID=2635139 RepID=UPI001C4F8B02|nr:MULTISPECIES: metal-dependent hydrolase [unclassified Tenacibaculum]QXP73952.1 metal-dependent hydrolase [Tenacibaculum sp. AHE14PA]QXP75681.1 metal-dependent hydrolase [Tenacibaculum sp. AHE15PA]WNW02239.1 metal-dependent hydrolase [Tenacibaculum sp. HL-MS23]